MLINQNNSRIFIEYLDNWKKKQKVDFDEILLKSLKHSVENGYNKSLYSGERFPKSAFSSYKASTQILTASAENIAHDVSLSQPDISNISIFIDVNIHSLTDILGIIQKYTPETGVKYNIDLSALHSIKDELNELNSMIGMDTLKTSIVKQLLYFLQGLHIGALGGDFKHTVIYGPPGTGKTEVAKIIGKMYSKVGILRKNVFKKVTRNDLVAGYLGQTALKTRKVIDECSGGVLFIDEAYSLANTNDLDSYSRECVDTLCEALSDRKDDLMVIIAGYEDELNNYFFASNRGLESRFIWRFKINDYSPKELMQIFAQKVILSGWKLQNDDIIDVKWFDKHKSRFKHYGRDMELLFYYTKIEHSRRIYGKPIELQKIITKEDIQNGFDVFSKNIKEENTIRKDLLNTLYI